MKFAILGAGLSGLAAANQLKQSGHMVELFDKGRGPGGRMSSRRTEIETQRLYFDHGAPAFAVTHSDVSDALEAWLSQGVVAAWPGPHQRRASRSADSVTSHTTLYVGQPKMNALIHHLADGFVVRWNSRVTHVARTAAGYDVSLEDQISKIGFDAVIFALPQEQTQQLSETADLSGVMPIETVSPSEPCWTVMVAYAEGTIGPDWSSLRLSDGPIAWISHENSKPQRTGLLRFVVQASPAWSLAHLEDAPSQIIESLLPDIAALTGASAPIHAQAHRWRFAQAKEPAGRGAIWDASQRIGVCGDWLHSAGGVEGAWLSGVKLANFIQNSTAV